VVGQFSKGAAVPTIGLSIVGEADDPEVALRIVASASRVVGWSDRHVTATGASRMDAVNDSKVIRVCYARSGRVLTEQPLGTCLFRACMATTTNQHG
jgi:hypothetical protein